MTAPDYAAMTIKSIRLLLMIDLPPIDDWDALNEGDLPGLP